MTEITRYAYGQLMRDMERKSAELEETSACLDEATASLERVCDCLSDIAEFFAITSKQIDELLGSVKL